MSGLFIRGEVLTKLQVKPVNIYMDNQKPVWYVFKGAPKSSISFLGKKKTQLCRNMLAKPTLQMVGISPPSPLIKIRDRSIKMFSIHFNSV